MKFELLGKEGAPSLMLIPGLGVSYEIFLPLVDHPDEVAGRIEKIVSDHHIQHHHQDEA